jgi:hypothetical protein
MWVSETWETCLSSGTMPLLRIPWSLFDCLSCISSSTSRGSNAWKDNRWSFAIWTWLECWSSPGNELRSNRTRRSYGSLLPWLQADRQSVESLSYCSIDTESSFLNPMIFRRYINCPDLDLERYRSCNAVVQHGYGSEKPQMTSTKQSLTEWSVINWRAIHRLSFSASLSAMLGWTNAVFPDIVSLQYAPNTERPDFDSFVIHHYIR